MRLTETETLSPVPYPENADGCHGYYDLKGTPDIIRIIPEAMSNPQLRFVLGLLNGEASPWKTTGCGYWLTQLQEKSYFAKSYFEITSATGDGSREDLERLYRSFEAGCSNRDELDIEFCLARIHWVKTDTYSPSVIVWCRGRGVDQSSANQCWANGMIALQKFFAGQCGAIWWEA